MISQRLDESSPAAEAGLRRGDIIHELNGKPIKTVAERGERLGVTRAIPRGAEIPAHCAMSRCRHADRE